MAALIVFGLSWVASLAVFVALDPTLVRDLVDTVANVPGERVERPDDPFFILYRNRFLGDAATSEPAPG